MKPSLVLALVLAGGTFTLPAQTNVSITITNPAGFSLISNPLNATNNNIDVLFADAPDYTKIIRFFIGSYQMYIKDPDEGWRSGDGPGAFALNPGEGVWLQVASTYVVTFTGQEVLHSTNPIPAGWSLKASIAPRPGIVGLPVGPFDKILRWNGSNYEQYILDPDDGWVPSPPPIKVGEGFWFVNGGAPKIWLQNLTP